MWHPQPTRHHESQGNSSEQWLPEVWLEIVRGRARNRFRPVGRRVFLLGRASDCDVVLADAHFPDSYAYLLRAEVGVNLRWLGDGPELRVNQRLVGDSASMHDGDLVRLGNQYELRLHIAWQPTAQADGTAERTEVLPGAGVSHGAWRQAEGLVPGRLRIDPVHEARSARP